MPDDSCMWKELREDLEEMFEGYASALSPKDTLPEGSAPIRTGANIRISEWKSKARRDRDATWKDPTERLEAAKERERARDAARAGTRDWTGTYARRVAANPEYRKVECTRAKQRYAELTPEQKAAKVAKAKAKRNALPPEERRAMFNAKHQARKAKLQSVTVPTI